MRGVSTSLGGSRVVLLLMVSFVLLVCWVYLRKQEHITLTSQQHSPLGKGLCTLQETKYAGLAEPEYRRFSDYDPEVCVIVRTYHLHRHLLPALIASLAASIYPNLHIFLVDTQGDFADLSSFESLFNVLYNKDFVHTSNITREAIYARFPSFQRNLNDYGYVQADLMMEELISSKKYQCDYFVATNGDNLYNVDFLAHTVEYTRKSTDLVAVGFASHYCFKNAEVFRPIAGCYAQQEPEFKVQRIDVGGALIRKEKMVEAHLNFVMNYLKNDPTGTHTEFWFLDGYFFQEMIKMNSTRGYVPGVYFTHQ